MILLTLLQLTAAHAADVVITKAQFLDGMKAGAAETFCDDKTYFRKCFSVSKDDCTKEVGSVAQACADKSQADVPAQLHQPADGQKWGEKIGACVGTKFEEDKAKLKLKLPDCEDASKWKAGS